MTTYQGIDYGHGKTNIDRETGIRYGVLPSGEVAQAWDESAEADYGAPSCPKCGQDIVEYDEDKHGAYEDVNLTLEIRNGESCTDYACEQCGVYVDTYDAWPQEPSCWFYKEEGYALFQGYDDSDLFVESSPYYTYAQFCSPCAPGAGYLLSYFEAPDDYEGTKRGLQDLQDDSTYWELVYSPLAQQAGFPKVYCLGHDWFEDGKAPYPVFRVEDDTVVIAGKSV